MKIKVKLITYWSSDRISNLVCDVKVIPNEDCVTQHKPLVCDARIAKSGDHGKKSVPKQCVWKLQQADLHDKYCETFTGEMNDTAGEQVDNIWSRLKQSLLSATEKTCGWTKKGIWRKQTWWWNEKVSKDISEKRRLWKLWKAGGSKDKYLDAKRKAHHAVYTAKRNAEKEKLASVKDSKEFCVAKQMCTENQDVIGEKCMRGDDGNLSLDHYIKEASMRTTL